MKYRRRYTLYSVTNSKGKKVWYFRIYLPNGARRAKTTGCRSKEKAIQYVEELVQEGKVSEKEIDRAVRNILKTESDFETFPCWSPDGRKLYYCVAHVPQLDALPDSLHQSYLLNHYDSLRNDIMSLSFDERTQQFGTPQLEVDCNALGKSATVPRVSPDGRYLLFTLGDYGQFHIWHKSADLYVKDLKTGQVRPLTEANSPNAESYHTWSSNGRWIVFSSRRDDGSYTRPYIAYFDTAGNAHKAFLLPQEDPEQNLLLLKSYNVPELSTDAVPYSADEFRKVIYDDTNVEQAKFIR